MTTLKDPDSENEVPRADGPGPEMVDLPLRPGPSARRDLEFDPLETEAPRAKPRERGGLGTAAAVRRHAEERSAYHGRPRRHKGLALVGLLALAAALGWLWFPAPPRASFSLESFDFGTVRVGESTPEQVLSVANAGERRLAISALTFSNDLEQDYEIVAETCLESNVASGSTCEVRLRFSPKTPGNRGGLLRFESNDRTDPAVALEALAVAPRLGVAPAAVSFGVVALESETEGREVTLSNVGTAALALDRIRIEGPAAGDFTRDSRCPSLKLEPGEACSFELRFAPSVSGPRRAELVVASDAFGAPGRIPIEGVGLWEGPPLDPDSESVVFEEQRLGKRSSAKVVKFFNRTGSAVSVDRTGVSKSSSFAIVADECRERLVVSGASCSVSITFLPIGDGLEQGTLTLAAAGATEVVEVGLRGRGVTPRVEASVRGVDFKEQRLGFESAPGKVQIRNTGSATLSVRSATVSGADRGEFRLGGNECVDKALAPGKSCTISVGFNPAKSGPRRALLSVDPGFELEPLRISLDGSGVVSALRADPGKLEFGRVYLGRLEPSILTLVNSGSARLELKGLRFEGDDAAAFELGKMACSLDSGLVPGAACRVEIRFGPERAGAYRAQLSLDYNGPDSPARVELAGEGREPAPAFRISTRSLDLGSARIGERGDIGTVTIGNPGAAWLELTSISLRGDHAENFQLVPGTCDGASALAPSGSCSVGVRLAPLVEGSLRAAILVRHGVEPGTATVALEGRGVPRVQ